MIFNLNFGFSTLENQDYCDKDFLFSRSSIVPGAYSDEKKWQHLKQETDFTGDKPKIQVFISTGEKSGDILGAAILKALYARDPSVQIAAVAGPLMKEFPIAVVEPMESFEVMGFIDVIGHAPTLIRLFRKIKQLILEANPELLIFIDYPGWHLQLAKSLRKAGYKGKIAQVVCPTIWAWKKKRAKTLETYFDYLFCLFPFEPPLFAPEKLQVFYVGHPLVEMIPPPQKTKEKLLLLFPGSRKGEIHRNLSVQLEAAEKFLVAHPDFRLAISDSTGMIEKLGVKALFFPPAENRAMMEKASLAIAKSGTVTLELALNNVQTVVIYVPSRVDYFIAKYIIRVNLPYLCIVNILLNDRLFPEHYGVKLSAESICQDLKTLPVVHDQLRSVFGNKKSGEEIVEILFPSAL